jgi:type I restriction enzyme S subunit
MTEDLPIVWDSVPLELVGMPSTSNVDPSKFPNEIFELYSVPSYANNKPEIVTGAEIRSTKQSVEIGDVLLCKIAPHLNRGWIVRELHNYRRIASSEWIVTVF